VKFGLARMKRFVAVVAATITLSSSFVALDAIDPIASQAATVGSGNCIATVDNTSGVSTFESGVYCYVAFKSTGITYSWTKPSTVSKIDLLVVAGGGGGGARHAGGGGAGGLIQLTQTALSASTVSISVGAGGNGASAQGAGIGGVGSNGANSVVSASGFTTQTAIGGGGGTQITVGNSGGSGGGGSCCVSGSSTPTAGQGNSGSQGSTGTYNGNGFWVGGAGGGAGSAGSVGSATAVAGSGGSGLIVSWISSTAQSSLGVGINSGGNTYFAGGGGGGTAVYGTAGSGGLGGGAAGGAVNQAGFDATANTGGGGGGGGYYSNDTSPRGGNGGSGVVVIRYLRATPVLSYNASNINSFDSTVSATAVNDLSESGANDGWMMTQSSGQYPGFDNATGAWTFSGGASGVGPYVDAPNLSTTQFATNGITVDFEADFGGTANDWERIIDFSEGGAQNDNVLVARFGNSNDLAFEIYSGMASQGVCRYVNGIPTSSEMARWTIHVDGSNCRMYKNGTLVYTQAYTAKPTSGLTWNDNYIGRSNWVDSSFQGSIRSVNIYAGAFAPSELPEISNKTATFDALTDGATAIMQTRLTSGSIRLPSPANRPGYVFTGWYTSTAIASRVGSSGDVFTPSSTTTLYAGWRTVDSGVTGNLILNFDATNILSFPNAATSANSIYPAVTPSAATSVTGTRDTSNSPGSLYLDATTNPQVVNFGAGGQYNIAGALTFETWVKFAQVKSGWNVIASHWFTGPTGTYNQDWHLAVNNGKLQLNAGASAVGYGSKTWSSADANTWYHIGFTLDASNNLQFYINGKPDGAPTANMAHSSNSTAQLWIGDGRNSNNTKMNGFISRARLYNTSLSSSQLRSNFNIEAVTYGLSNVYTLTYKAGPNGSGSDVVEYYSSGSSATLANASAAFTRTGYVISGWTTSSTSGASQTNALSSSLTISADTILYPVWSSASYTITYNYNGATGGNTTTSSSYTSGGTAITLPTPTKTGYTFGGWYSDAGLTIAVTGTQTPNSSYTLYAKWDAGTYTLTYTYNGATGGAGTTTSSYTTGGTAITLPTPTKTGYTFGGWYAENTFVTAVTGAQTPSASATLYAKWTAGTYTLTYTYNGATGGAGTASSSYTTGGSAITLPTPSKTGYTFGGWYAESTFVTAISGTQTPAADATLYAKWNNGTYTLTYNYNSATGGNGTVSDSFTTGGTAITLPAPTRTGYNFAGWFAENTFVTAVTGAQSPTASATLYAKWTAGTYTLTYTYNGATGGNGSSTASYTTGGSTITLPTPTKTGYTFAGWFAESTFATSVTGAQSPSADATIYAKWTAINYTLTYNSNSATSGSVPVDATNYNIGSNASVAANSGNLVRTGYTFAGWTLNAGGTGTVYNSGDALLFGAAAQVLYAKWTANTYAITYNTNGATGTQANASDSYTTGSTAVTLSAVGTMAKTGYTFAGWATTANGTAIAGTYTTSVDITLYAVWNIRTISVTYSKGAASSASFISFPSNTSGNYASRINTSNNIDSSVTFNGSTYAFVGWSDGTSMYQSGQQYLLGASDVTLTAIWVQAFGVRYIFNGGTPANGTSAIDAECLVVGNLCTDQQSVISNAAPLRDGYVFTGWRDQSNNSIAAAASFTVTINAYLLYAQWQAINYNITYLPNGGASTPTQNALHYGDTFTVANAITRTGYNFTGWSDGVSIYGAGATYTVGLSAISLTAQWSPKTYVIRYDWNGGTGSSVANVNYTVGNPGATLATVGDHVKDGYQFGGWALTIGGDAVASPYVATADTVLYAIWGSGSYSVTFNQNYGLQASSTTNVANGSSTVLPTLTRNNFVFDGWYTAATGGTKVGNGGASYTPSASRQLYARWIQSSLYGVTGNLSHVSSITVLNPSLDSTYIGTNGGSGVAVTVPGGSLPVGTIVNIDLITDTSYAQSLLSGHNNYILSLAVSWLALDETVPNTANGTSISLTLTNSNIRAGALIFSVQDGVATLLGTATANGTLTVQLSSDPSIYVVQTVANTPRSVASTVTATSGTITWLAPLSDGGATITGYTVTLNNGATCTTALLTCTFNNLTTGTSYTASIVATNSVGNSSVSTISFTPAAPVVNPPVVVPPVVPPVVTPPTPPTEPEVPAKPVVVVVPVVTAVEKVLANNVPVLAGTPLVSPILFAADSPKLDATDFAAIKKAAAAVAGRQGMILITGFVKYVGKLTPKIKALAAQRAKNVANAMAKLGVKVKIGYLGYGPMNTKSPKNTDRKVEMRWVEASASNS
jgi:uncharacterized repeat protein (TIGR02543 family)